MNKIFSVLIVTLSLIFLFTVGVVFAQQRGNISSVGGSGANGNFRLEPTDSQTIVAVDLGGLSPGTSHIGHIHFGNCSNIGEIQTVLGTITANSGGFGSLTTTVDVSLSTLQLGNRVVAFHQEAAPESQIIACGEISSTVSNIPMVPETGLGGSSR